MASIGKELSLFELAKQSFIQCSLGGMSCGVATVATNPIDVVKVRMQLANKVPGQKLGMGRTFLNVAKTESVQGLYKGLFASILRSFSYSAIRLGLYGPAKSIVGADSDPTLLKKMLSGSISGSIAAGIANPIELVKVRLQADCARGNEKLYRGIVDAFVKITRTEGLMTFKTGLFPHICRGAVITCSQVATYDHVKCFLRDRMEVKEGVGLHFLSSLVAGLVVTTASSPLDVIKTNMMHAGKFNNAFECIQHCRKTGGVMSFFKGWLPNYTRLGPHTLITFLVFEQLRRHVGLNHM
eukprot:TRINITY_DN260494_c0_g2_i2.p1 TRINITY_DN260494_c0_g2~~TRINITY_DN260494_c0_g2_i2.p1  ORF type:complete len:297 (+),score=52.66 TRINITY_DN260494_c0_g2_i2:47-937(+)